MKENTYWQRTDTFEEKMRLLQEAYRRKDYRLARSIGDSLRQSLTLEQQQSPIGTPVLTAGTFVAVSDLPPQWREWARGWSYAKILALDETVSLPRTGEPIEIVAAFSAGPGDVADARGARGSRNGQCTVRGPKSGDGGDASGQGTPLQDYVLCRLAGAPKNVLAGFLRQSRCGAARIRFGPRGER